MVTNTGNGAVHSSTSIINTPYLYGYALALDIDQLIKTLFGGKGGLSDASFRTGGLT